MLSKFKSICLCLILAVAPALSTAEIIKINNLNDLKAQLQSLDKNDLVIFDIDDVVIQPVDQVFHPHHKKELAKYYSDIQSQISQDQMNDLLSTVNIQQQVKLVDPDIKEIFAMLRKRTIPTVALTHCGTGKFGKINDVADWRIAQLQQVGVSFAKLSPYKDQVYSSLQGKHGTAMFKSGILFTGYVDKGQVLVEFLKENNITPRKIIFIDDRKVNLDNVATFLETHNIAFTGFEYVAVSEQPVLELDLKATDLQFSVLRNESNWLPDSSAKVKTADLK